MREKRRRSSAWLAWMLTALGLMLNLCSCGIELFSTADNPETEQPLTWQEQYDLGMRYLSEGNYEEAILAFTAAIEIDPRQAETYERLADAYLALDDEDSALKILWDGYDATSGTRLLALIDELTQPEPTPTPESTSAANSGTAFVIENGVLVKYNGPGGEVRIPDEVTQIGERAFENCVRVTRVIFPKQGCGIASYAFYGCTGLTYIENSGGIGLSAFEGCAGLTEVVCNGGIGPSAFEGCTSLTKLTIRGGIGPRAFAGCTRLSQIWILSAGIAPDAFSQCAGLTDVYYSGTQEQWAALISNGPPELANATVHYNS